MHGFTRALFSGLLLAQAGALSASGGLAVQQVTENVYAIVGELGNRTAENLGNNATFGVVVTTAGVVLIDPGGTHAGARRLHDTLRQITGQPVVRVINTGGQDHRWLGNGYFKALGAEIIASRAAVEDQRARAEDQLFGLRSLLGEAAVHGTIPVHADLQFEASLEFELGATAFVLRHPGPAHTPGDSYLWLPRERVLFSGDIVYTERMLGITEVSSSKHWVAAFAALAAEQPLHVIPGHGRPTTLARATADTRDYLVFLRQAVGAFMEGGGDITRVGEVDQARFAHLLNFEQLAGRNAQQVFSELEWE
jgi:glyoxylase-like metal-dependent hydrolase (beta-lactamase superfamily II)